MSLLLLSLLLLVLRESCPMAMVLVLRGGGAGDAGFSTRVGMSSACSYPVVR